MGSLMPNQGSRDPRGLGSLPALPHQPLPPDWQFSPLRLRSYLLFHPSAAWPGPGHHTITRPMPWPPTKLPFPPRELPDPFTSAPCLRPLCSPLLYLASSPRQQHCGFTGVPRNARCSVPSMSSCLEPSPASERSPALGHPFRPSPLQGGQQDPPEHHILIVCPDNKQPDCTGSRKGN